MNTWNCGWQYEDINGLMSITDDFGNVVAMTNTDARYEVHCATMNCVFEY